MVYAARVDQPADDAADLERLITQLSASFVNLPAESIGSEIEAAVGRIAQFAGADRATVARLAEDGARFSRTNQWVGPGFARVEGAESRETYPWLSRRVFDDQHCVVLSRLDDLPAEAKRDRETLERLHVKSLVVFPLAVGDSVLGALSFATLVGERGWPPELVDRLRVASSMLASALARERVHGALAQTLAFDRLVAELSTAFIDLPGSAIDDHVTSLIERVARFLDLDRSHVAQATGKASGLQVTHQWARDEAWRTPSIVMAQAVPWLTARLLAGEAVVFSTQDELPIDTEAEREFMARHGPRSSAVLPLVVSGTVIGAVAFGTVREQRTWTKDVLERLQLVSQIIASALARKRAEQELRDALADNELLRVRLQAENAYLQTEMKNLHLSDDIVGRSPAIRAVLHKADQVAPTDVPVLLLGETGTGKELIAHAIHLRSRRSNRALIAVNCAALPPTLVESELFGHEKGAFTGASQARAGRFELADGSTLFLDEIGDLEPAMQAKLLRALQSGEVQRVGSSRTLKVDVRLVAATNRDLDSAMREGRFRTDLYYRLGVFPIQLPSLRERREDIPLLVWHFIQSRQRALGREITEIARGDMDALTAYDWPGNVRELQNVIDRALILSPGPALRLVEAFSPSRPIPLRPTERAAEDLRHTERTHIIEILDRCRWTIEGRGQAADRLGLHPSTLRNRMKKLGIRRPPSS